MPKIADAMLETMNITILDVTFGCLLSNPLAILAACNSAPNLVVRTKARFRVSVARTTPVLIWALNFVVTVGPRPLAGILAYIMDMIGSRRGSILNGLRRSRKAVRGTDRHRGVSFVGDFWHAPSGELRVNYGHFLVQRGKSDLVCHDSWACRCGRDRGGIVHRHAVVQQ